MEKKRTPQRASINGRRQRLNVRGGDANYDYRIVNIGKDGEFYDERVEELMDIGYEVDKTVNVGDKRAGAPSPTPGARLVNLGQGDKGVVMRIRKDLAAERRAEKDALNRDIVDNLQDPNLNGADYGKVKLTRD